MSDFISLVSRSLTQPVTGTPFELGDLDLFSTAGSADTEGAGAAGFVQPLVARQEQGRYSLHPAIDSLVREGVARTVNFEQYGQQFYPYMRDAFSSPQVSAYTDRFAEALREYNALADKDPSLPRASFALGLHRIGMFSGGAAQNGLDYDKNRNTLELDISLGEQFLEKNDVTGDPPPRRGTTAIPENYETMFRPPEIAVSNELVEQTGRLGIITDLARQGESVDVGRMVAANIIGSTGFQTATWAIDSVFPDYAYETTGEFGRTAAERSRNTAAALEKADPKVLAGLLNDAAATVTDEYGSNPYVETRDWVDNLANYDPIETKHGSFGHKNNVREGSGYIEALATGGGDGVTVTKDGAITLGNAREVAQEQLQAHLDAQLPPSMKGKIKVELVEKDGKVLPHFTAP